MQKVLPRAKIIFPALAFAAIFIFSSAIALAHGGAVIVEMTEDGFSPDSVEIRAGTEVTWVNVGGTQHWPASNTHPTHTIYPGSDIQKCATNEKEKILDACGPMKKGDRYSFVFGDEGEWGMHDHLRPGLVMSVKVLPDIHEEKEGGFDFLRALSEFFSSVTGMFAGILSTQPEVEVPDASSFRSLAYSEQVKILESLSGKTPEDAWEYLKSAFTVNGQIKENPHEFAHIAGNALYAKRGVDGISACDPTFAFGCYHGVAEEMLLDVGKDGVTQIESACYKFFPQDSALAASCVHGIGHGLLTWNSLDVDKSLVDCDLLGAQNRQYCYDGVFMENAPNAKSSPEKTSWDFCSGFGEAYHPACAKYQVYGFGETVNWDFAKMAQFCDSAPNQILRNSCFPGFGFFAANAAQGDADKAKEICALSPSEDGRYMCTMSAAVEIIFQEYSKWWEESDQLCASLPGGWGSECASRTRGVAQAYGRSAASEEPEITQIKSTTNLDEQVKFYRKLVERIGPEQAQDRLYLSGMPFTGQTHLLNHVVGDYLYENYGSAGIVKCKEYFLASCYHGVILHAIGDVGIEGLDEMVKECKKFGLSVTAQCSHALGHGFLANIGYDKLDQAPYFCDDIAERVDGFPRFNCYDGVFMENIWGIHSGEPSEDRWVNASDPVYPCNDPRINPSHLDGCWSNQPSLMYQMFDGDIKRVGEECLKVGNATHKPICFNALARQIHPITKGNLNSAFQLCSLLPGEWVNFCLSTISVSDFSVGGRDLSFRICAIVDESEKPNCYQGLFGAMSVYAKGSEEYKSWCGKVLEENWKAACVRPA